MGDQRKDNHIHANFYDIFIDIFIDIDGCPNSEHKSRIEH